jgi:oligosaccharide repeat unit polymerase
MNSRKIESFISALLLVILTVLFLFFENGVNDFLLLFCLLIFYRYFYISITKSFKVKSIKTYFKIDLLFLLFYYIIYYYPYQMYLLGFFDLSEQLRSYDSYILYTNKAVIAATIGLIAFMEGYKTLAYYKSSKKVSSDIVTMKFISKLFLLLMILILIAFFVSGGASVFIGIYAGSNTGSITGNAIFSLVNYFLILGLVQVIFYYYQFKKIPFVNYIILFIVSFWSFALLYLGDRNTFFLIAIIAGGGISTYIRNISRIQIIFLGVFAFFLYNVVEVSRVSEDKKFSSITNDYLEAQEKNNDIAGLSSFNTTTIGLRATFKAVPEKQDFFYGKFKLVSFTTLIPYSSRLFFSADDPFLGSSNVIKDEMISLRAGWGTGTNIISDCYMDFGIPGIIVLMFILGYYAGKVRNSCIKDPDSAKFIFIYLLILGYYSEIARYGFDFPLRALIWTPVIFYFLENRKSNLIKLKS